MSTATEDIPKVREQVGVTYPLYADPEREVMKAWGVADPEQEIAVPATFIVGADGKIRYVHVGTNKKDRPVLADVLAVLRYLNE